MRSCISILLLTLMALPASSEELTVNHNFNGRNLRVSVRLDCGCEETMFQSLEDGMEGEVVFEIRLYEEGRGFFSHWGGRLVAERTVTLTARKNFFDNAYMIENPQYETASYADHSEFIDNFLSISGIDLGKINPAGRSEYYLLTRARLTHVKLMPPLALITLFQPLGIATEWHRQEIRPP